MKPPTRTPLSPVAWLAVTAPYVVAWLVLMPVRLLGLVRLVRRPRPTGVAIEAGVKGWQSIEFKEYLRSAEEYCLNNPVHKVVIEDRRSYWSESGQAVRSVRPSHLLYDPRTGSQSWVPALMEALRIAWWSGMHGLVPIVLLTNPSERRWRAQAAVATSVRGVVVTFMSASAVRRMFPHSRIVGPALMPFSRRLLRELKQLRSMRAREPRSAVAFVGSLYEPRASRLRAIEKGLDRVGVKLTYVARQFGGDRVADEDYWSAITNAEILVSTTAQQTEFPSDAHYVPQVVYRFMESLACGTLLISESAPGVARYLIPDIHFVEFKDPDDAVAKIVELLEDGDRRALIANRGRARAEALIETNAFWTAVDIALGPAGIHGYSHSGVGLSE